MAWEGLNPPYATIVADPPWPFDWNGGKGGRRRRSTPLHYSRTTVDEIAAMTVADLAAEDCTLFLWATREVYREGDAVRVARGKVHSAKPPGFGDAVEANFPGPYLELFARAQRLGWDHWGHGYETGAA